MGDRVVSVNHQSNLTLQEINAILDMGNGNVNSTLTLQVEFDVADTIVPSSGIFTVKLARRAPGLGITITGTSKNTYLSLDIPQSILSAHYVVTFQNTFQL